MIIQNITEGGGTNIQAGLLQGYLEMTKFKNFDYPRLLLLTDGNSNITSISSEQLSKKLEVEYIEGLRISTIGLGYDVNQELLREIANQGKGHFYFVDKSETLSKIIKDDLFSLILPVVKNVNISIRMNEGYKISNIYGYEKDDTFSSAYANLKYAELNMNDWRIAIIEIERKMEISGESIPLSTELNFEIIKDSRKINLEKSTIIRWYEPKDYKLSKPNSLVARNSLIFGNALALIQVGKLSEQDRYNEALDVLNLQINNNIVFFESLDSKELKDEIDRLYQIRKILLDKINNKTSDSQKLLISAQNDIYYEESILQVQNRESKIHVIIDKGINVADMVVPGIWTTIARLVNDAVF